MNSLKIAQKNELNMARRMESVGYKVVVNRGDYH